MKDRVMLFGDKDSSMFSEYMMKKLFSNEFIFIILTPEEVTENYLIHYLNDSKCKHLIIDKKYADVLDMYLIVNNTSLRSLKGWTEDEDPIKMFVDPNINASTVLYGIYSDGSTSFNRKLIMKTKLSFDKETKLLQGLPLNRKDISNNNYYFRIHPGYYFPLYYYLYNIGYFNSDNIITLNGNEAIQIMNDFIAENNYNKSIFYNILPNFIKLKILKKKFKELHKFDKLIVVGNSISAKIIGFYRKFDVEIICTYFTLEDGILSFANSRKGEISHGKKDLPFLCHVYDNIYRHTLHDIYFHKDINNNYYVLSNCGIKDEEGIIANVHQELQIKELPIIKECFVCESNGKIYLCIEINYNNSLLLLYRKNKPVREQDIIDIVLWHIFSKTTDKSNKIDGIKIISNNLVKKTYNGSIKRYYYKDEMIEDLKYIESYIFNNKEGLQ